MRINERTLVMYSRLTQRPQVDPVRNFGDSRRTPLGRLGILFIVLLLLLCAGFSQAQETLSLTFQLPLERASHSFRLFQKMGETGGYVTQTLLGGTLTYYQDDGSGTMVPTSTTA